ncbi:MAG TPA: response regulator, partial [Sphingomicrobium sp.]|nr:response regulator [Sphingomicrobium sp.]
GPRILIVDPKRTNLTVLARRLGDEGYRIATAETGQAAIAELHRNTFQMILAELYMPGMSGSELVRAVRSESVWRDIPIILITGRSAPGGAVQAYAAGADDVVLKPFHFEVLAARIERRLARAKAIEELRRDNATLDARVVTRAIELGEVRVRLLESEAELRRLAGLVVTERPETP